MGKPVGVASAVRLKGALGRSESDMEGLASGCDCLSLLRSGRWLPARSATVLERALPVAFSHPTVRNQRNRDADEDRRLSLITGRAGTAELLRYVGWASAAVLVTRYGKVDLTGIG